MRKTSVMILVLLLIPVLCFGANIDALKAERANLLKVNDMLEKEWDMNEAKRAKLEQRKSDLEWSSNVVKKEVNKWNVDSARLDQEASNHEAVINSHNSQCGGTFDDQAYVDACNRTADQLDARTTSLNREIDYMNERRQKVAEMVATQEQEEAKLNQEISTYNAYRAELIDAGLKIEARLKEIQAQVDSCEDAIRSGSPEKMKAECGKMFDGNVTKEERDLQPRPFKATPR